MLVRDPRDIAVSYYHYQIKMRRFDDGYPLEDFVSSFVSGEIGRYGSWGENVGSWIGARQGTDGFLLLRYEDMLRETVHELGKIAEFLSLDLSKEHLEQVVELSSADRMRRLEREQAASWRPIQKSRKDKSFVRTAMVGAWRDELSDSTAKRIEIEWSVQMKLLGYLG